MKDADGKPIPRLTHGRRAIHHFGGAENNVLEIAAGTRMAPAARCGIT
jgi:hypothetical protein